MEALSIIESGKSNLDGGWSDREWVEVESQHIAVGLEDILCNVKCYYAIELKTIRLSNNEGGSTSIVKGLVT